MDFSVCMIKLKTFDKKLKKKQYCTLCKGESLYGVIARGEEGEIAADGIGIGAVAVSGKVEVSLVLAGGELLPAPPHVVADEDEDDVRVRGALGEVVPECGHGVEVVVAVDRHHAHLRNGRIRRTLLSDYYHAVLSAAGPLVRSEDIQFGDK